MIVKSHLDCSSCGHRDCLTEYEDHTYCFSCNKYTSKETKVVEYTPRFESFRSIEKEVTEFYGTTVGYSSEGSPVVHEYKYPTQTKYRWLPKDFSKNKGFRSDELFGMDKFNASSSKTIVIAEGEVDTMSVFQMLGKKFPVVGLPSASISHALLKNCHDFLDSYSKIVLCTDNDDAGDKAANKLNTSFPNKVYRVKMTKHKDPNEFLTNGAQEDFVYAFSHMEKFVPEGIFNTQEQFKTILRTSETNKYLPTPITKLNETIKGLMQGHFLVLTGPEGQGKTEVLRMMEYHLLENHTDTPIGILHMEESKKTTLISYACYKLGVNLRDPDHSVPPEAVEAAIAELTASENLYLLDHTGDEDPLAVLDKVRYLAEVCGCKYIFIDPIQQLSYGKGKDMTETQMLDQISVRLEKASVDYDVGIICTAHVNDEGATRSSRMIGKSASVRIDLERNHMHPDPEVRNKTILKVSKNRPTGITGFAGELVFDPTTFTLEESTDVTS